MNVLNRRKYFYFNVDDDDDDGGEGGGVGELSIVLHLLVFALCETDRNCGSGG